MTFTAGDLPFFRITASPRFRRWFIFAIGGLLNTGLTYLVYVALSFLINYQVAYAVGYAFGIGFSYLFNARFVFSASISIKSAAAYPLVYVAQYVFSALALELLVGALRVPKMLAPLCLIFFTIPLTYALSKMVITMEKTHDDLVDHADGGHGIGWWLAHFVVVPMLVVAAIWLPFGFAMGGLIEEWDILGLFGIHGTFFITSVHSPLPTHALRPLTIFPQAVAYALGPDSTLSWHLLLMASLVIKGAAMGHLALRASRRVPFAVFVSALVLIYPADTMQLSFRSIHIDWGLALELVASSLFVEATLTRNRVTSWVASIAAGVVLLCSICMYEAALPLVIFPVIVLAVREPLRDTWSLLRSRWHVTVFWLTALTAYLAYVAVTSPQITSYQQSVLGDKHLLLRLLQALPKLFTVGLLRAILGGWYDAVAMVFVEFKSLWYLSIVTMFLIAAIWILTRRKAVPTDDLPSMHRSARALIGGLILACAGYAPFLISPAHLAITQRTYLFASPGAALAWAGILLALGCSHRPWRRWLASCIAAFMVFFGLGAQLVQMHHYDDISATQRRHLDALLQALGPRPQARQILILDGTDELGQTWMFLPGALDITLPYFYGRSVGAVEICRMPEGTWQTVNALGRVGTCTRDSKGWILTEPSAINQGTAVDSSPKRYLADADTTVITLAADGSAYPMQAPQDPALDASIVERRTKQLRATAPWTWLMFRDQESGPIVKADFGRWWSLEKVIRGTGWREPEWNVGYFHHQSSVWKVAGHASLVFDIRPTDTAYVLRGKFSAFANETVRSRLKISVNGTPINVEFDQKNRFEGRIPARVLHNGRNLWTIDGPTVDAYYGLSARLERYEFRPAAATIIR